MLSPAGVATVEVANPNRYALRGTVRVGGGQVAGRTVRLPRLAVTDVALRFDTAGVDALAAAAGHAALALRTRRAGGRATVARRLHQLRRLAVLRGGAGELTVSRAGSRCR